MAALYTTTQTPKQAKWPPTDDWIQKMRYISTMEYYSALKKKEILPCAATQEDLEMLYVK